MHYNVRHASSNIVFTIGHRMRSSPFEVIHTPHKKKFNKHKATNTKETILLQC